MNASRKRLSSPSLPERSSPAKTVHARPSGAHAPGGKLSLKLPRTAQARTLLPRRESLLSVLQEEWLAHRADAAQLEVYFVDESTIRQLHQDYLNDPSPTDIITFDLGLTPEQVRLGALYICPEVAKRYAAKRNLAVAEEIQRLIAHGVLHLLGYDDRSLQQKRRMRRAENKILARLGMKKRTRARPRIQP